MMSSTLLLEFFLGLLRLAAEFLTLDAQQAGLDGKFDSEKVAMLLEWKPLEEPSSATIHHNSQEARVRPLSSMKKSRENLRDLATFISLAFVTVLGIVPFAKTGFEGLIQPVDANFPLFPIEALENKLWMWNPKHPMFGTNTALTTTAVIPVCGLFAALSSVGLTPAIVERIWLVTAFSSLGWSMYCLSSIVIQGPHKRVGQLISSAFYMYNPLTVGALWTGNHLHLFAMASAPIMLGLLIRGLTDNDVLKYSFLMGLATVQASIVNVQVLALQLWLPMLFFIAHAIGCKSIRILLRSLRFLVITAVISLALNLFWILPTIESFWYYLPLYVQEYRLKIPPTYESPQLLFTTLLLGYGLSLIHI